MYKLNKQFDIKMEMILKTYLGMNMIINQNKINRELLIQIKY